MKKFETNVNAENREEMVTFLKNHFRYDTANGWNCSTSYANCVKLYKLGLGELEDACDSIIETSEFWENANALIADFNVKHNYLWQVSFNGRSGGYLVLYRGGQKETGYKSFCTECGQRNYKTIEESGKKCGFCGAMARTNYAKPLMQSFVYPGKSVDMGEDFEDWDIEDIKARVKLVSEFDKLADDILSLLVDMAENYRIVDEIVYVPKVVKRIVEK